MHVGRVAGSIVSRWKRADTVAESVWSWPANPVWMHKRRALGGAWALVSSVAYADPSLRRLFALLDVAFVF
jgi:hypothetical protein